MKRDFKSHWPVWLSGFLTLLWLVLSLLSLQMLLSGEALPAAFTFLAIAIIAVLPFYVIGFLLQLRADRRRRELEPVDKFDLFGGISGTVFIVGLVLMGIADPDNQWDLARLGGVVSAVGGVGVLVRVWRKNKKKVSADEEQTASK